MRTITNNTKQMNAIPLHCICKRPLTANELREKRKLISWDLNELKK
jgi:hypothetical protein